MNNVLAFPNAVTELSTDEVELVDGAVGMAVWAAACAIVGIAVASFQAGYAFGKDLAS